MVGSTGVGYLAAAVAVICFGSSFVPVKKFKTGDGMFFQWVMCSAIWIVGLIVNLIRTSYDHGLNSTVQFYPFAMLGGIVWCIGNSLAVTVIKCIGLSLGMCTWGTVNLVMGWASGSFGLFGLSKQTVTHPSLNYAGAAVAVIGVIVFAMVKPSEPEEPENNIAKKYDSNLESRFLLSDPYRVNDNNATPANTEESLFDRMGAGQKRLIGLTLSAISGVFYGLNFDPPQYIMDHTTDKNGLDYVFSHFCGIMVASTCIIIIYSAFMKNKPILYPEALLPGILSGVLWAIAQTSFFIANEKLMMVVSFPIIATGPGIVASLWGVFAFKEIRGTKNFLLLAAAFCIIIVAVVLIALSQL